MEKTNFKLITKDLYRKTNLSKDNADLIFKTITHLERTVLRRDCYKRMGSLFRATHELFLEQIKDFNWIEHHLILNKTKEYDTDIYRFDKRSFSKSMKNEFYNNLVIIPVKISNKYSHYSQEDIKMILGNFRLKEPSINETIKFLKALYDAMKEMILLNNKQYQTKPFDTSIYDDDDLMWKQNKTAMFLKEFNLGKECYFCKEGKLQKPENETFPFGAYLKCDHCNAILSSNLNLKVARPNSKCTSCKKESLKDSYNVITKERYLICLEKDCFKEIKIKN